MAVVYVIYLHIHCAVDAVKLYFTLDMLLLSLCFIYTGMKDFEAHERNILSHMFV